MTQRRDDNHACCWQIKNKNVFAFLWDAKAFSVIETASVPLPNESIQ